MQSRIVPIVLGSIAALTILLVGFHFMPERCKPCPQPDPTPQPQPPTPTPPNPQPDPVVGKVTGVIIVEDTAKADQSRGLFFGDPKVSAFFKNSGLAHAVIPVSAVDEKGQTPADAKKYLDEAKAKGTPRLFMVDDKGAVLKQQDMTYDPDAFVKLFEAPHARAMGNLAPPPGRVKGPWKVFGATPNTKLIPRDQWKEVSLGAYLPPVHDQDGRGQCNASATCSAIEACRIMSGQPYVYLSAGDLYSLINGGRDQGSLLEDGLQVASETGIASAKLVPYVWDGRQYQSSVVKADRARNRVIEAYLCPTFDHVASAAQQGFFIVEGLLWYDNFNPDRNGWLPLRGAGNYGGHALCGYGLVKHPTAANIWGIKTRNSWGVTWGLGGDCVIPETLFGQEIGGFWAVRAVVQPSGPTMDLKLAKPRLSPSELLNSLAH